MSVSQAVPLSTNLKRQRKGLSGRSAARIAFVLGLASLLFCMGSYLGRDQTLSSLMMLFGVVVLILSIVTPPFIAAIAASVTASDLMSDEYRSLACSNVTDSAIVRGYVGTALFRARVVLVLVIGLMPVLVLGLSYAVLFVSAIGSTYRANVQIAPGVNWLNDALGFLAFTLGLWGLILLSAGVGVWLVLWSRNAWTSANGVPSGIRVRTAPALVFVLMILVMILDHVVGSRSLVVLAALPYLLAAGLIFLTGRWARQRSNTSPA